MSADNQSALDKLLADTKEHWPRLQPKAAAELAALRATLAEQARALAEAREIIDHYVDCPTEGACGMRDIARNWLSAHPSVEPQL